MLSTTYALVSLAFSAAGLVAGGPSTRESGAAEILGPDQGSLGQTVTYSADARAVSNWRQEAVEDLSPTPLSALAVLVRAERPVITRCVKLNNYWCIKSARWNGEIGRDEEGHVGFASADRGADAAVRLLRRYYLDFDRKSALDIVRRWAPAECRIASGSSGPPAVLAMRGIGNTLRARWLAARKTKPVRTKVAAVGAAVPIVQRPAAARPSAVPLRPLPKIATPSIMGGVSAPQRTAAATLPTRMPPRRQPTPASVAAAKAASAQTTPARRASAAPTRAASAAAKASAPVAVSAVPAPPPRPEPVRSAAAAPAAPRTASACAPDEQRIQNYAARMVRGLGLQPGDDLALFETDGRPLPNLARVLLAMSSFELGYLSASAELVEAAVLRATPRPAPIPEPTPAPPAEPVL